MQRPALLLAAAAALFVGLYCLTEDGLCLSGAVLSGALAVAAARRGGPS